MESLVRTDTDVDTDTVATNLGSRPIGEIVGEVLARAPEWVRHDIGSKDQQTRARAEETLAAMISAALRPPVRLRPDGRAPRPVSR